MVVGPRRLPSRVQVEAEGGRGLALVGSCRIEGDGCHARLIGQSHLTYMPMDLPWPMRVPGIAAKRLPVDRPREPAFDTHRHHANLEHARDANGESSIVRGKASPTA